MGKPHLCFLEGAWWCFDSREDAEKYVGNCWFKALRGMTPAKAYAQWATCHRIKS